MLPTSSTESKASACAFVRKRHAVRAEWMHGKVLDQSSTDRLNKVYNFCRRHKNVDFSPSGLFSYLSFRWNRDQLWRSSCDPSRLREPCTWDFHRAWLPCRCLEDAARIQSRLKKKIGQCGDNKDNKRQF